MIAALWLILVLLVLPFGIGLALVPLRSTVQGYLTGLCTSWGLYEILAFVFHCTLWPLHIMTVLWVVLCVVLACGGFYHRRASIRKRMTSVQLTFSSREWLLLTLVGMLVLAQALHIVFSTYYGNWDDSTYCAIATTSWYTDTANRFSPNTGMPGEILYGGKYVLAFWPVFSASLAQLTGVHPAIVFRTLMPLFEVCLAYGILYLLARFFFPKDREKALWTMVVATVVVLIAADKMPENCAEWWLTVNPWTGKAIASNIMVPMILWILFHLEEAEAQQRRFWWRSLFAACLASCMVAGTMFVLVPVELAIWGAFYLVRTRRWKDSLRFFLCGVPALVCTGLVYFPALRELLTK